MLSVILLLLALLWLLLLTWGLTRSVSPLSSSWFLQFPGADKVLHFVGFAGLSFFCFLGLQIKKLRWLLLILAFLFLIFYGLSTEIIQSWIPGRQSSILDFVADVLGVIAGWLLADFIRVKVLRDVSG